MNAPEHTQKIVGAYLSDRKIQFTVGHEKKEFRVEAGVPQGSVIGPCLWNVMYNGLLKQKLPEDVKIIAFADNVAVVATEWHKNFLEEAFGIVEEWMQKNGLTLAEHKTKVIVFTTRYTQKNIKVRKHDGEFE